MRFSVHTGGRLLGCDNRDGALRDNDVAPLPHRAVGICVRMTLLGIRNIPRRTFRGIFGRPFPSQICFADVRGILHRLSRDRLKGLAPEHIGRERRKQVDRQLSCAT